MRDAFVFLLLFGCMLIFAAAAEEELLLLNPALRLLVEGRITVVNRGEMRPAAFRAFRQRCHLP